MRHQFFRFAAYPLLIVVLSGCGGGSSQQGSIAPIEIEHPEAIADRTDIIGGSGGTPTADYVPVSVHITAAQNDIPPEDIISYDVYRTPTTKAADATLVVTQKTEGPLNVHDDSLPIGTRTDYKIVLNYTTGQTADGTPILKSKTLQLTNFVTQIEPTENANISPSGTGVVQISVPATRGADDYILDVSATSGFNSKQRFTPSSKGTYTAPADSPRHGTTVTFGAINIAQAFPGATTLYCRVGARDSRNGTFESSNPYVFTDSQQFTTP